MKPIKTLLTLLTIPLGLSFAADVSYALSGACKIKYKGMDKNGDCVITQGEWTGSNQAFNNHDWNEDGVLSGLEVKPGAKKPKGFVQKDYTAYRFDQIDTNNDMIISRSEWRSSTESFNSLDDNRDGVLTKMEFESRSVASTGDPFKDLDTNHDGNISLSEWNQSRTAFDNLDDNRNSLISAQEYHERSTLDRFGELDHNRDGYLVTTEWHASSRSFNNLDRNRDGKITRDEYNQTNRGQTVFSELDSNGDGRISKSEWRGTLTEFDRLDRNNDIVLTTAEFYETQSTSIVDRIFEEIFR